jgi:hypothetical protein
MEGKVYELEPCEGVPDPLVCVDANEQWEVSLPRGRRHVWQELVSQAFGERMRIVEVIGTVSMRAEPEHMKPVVQENFQSFSLWTPVGIADIGKLSFLMKPKVDAGWTELRLGCAAFGERKHYGIFRGSQELTWKQIPREPVVIVPKAIPKRPRGNEANTVTMMSSRKIREDRLMIQTK